MSLFRGPDTDPAFYLKTDPEPGFAIRKQNDDIYSFLPLLFEFLSFLSRKQKKNYRNMSIYDRILMSICKSGVRVVESVIKLISLILDPDSEPDPEKPDYSGSMRKH
jgi:hypothetical protein